MSNHTPTADHNLITCDACAYRAIVTNRGLFIRNIGHSPIDHQALLERRQAEARALVKRQLRRLIEAYHSRRPLPEADDNRDDLVAAGVMDARTLTMRQVHDLARRIRTEHGI